MKKTVGVFSLIVMVLTQIITPYAYAVGDVSPVDEVVTDAVVVEEPMVLEPIEDEGEGTEGIPVVIEQEAPAVVDELEEGNDGEVETQTGDTTVTSEKQIEEVTSGDNEILSGEQENLEGEIEELTGTESSSGFIDGIAEGVKNLLGIGGTSEDEEIIESKEIYGTGEYEGVKVEVYAATGLFESGTILTIEPVIEEKLEQVKEVLSGEVEMVEEEEEQTVVAFDITFRDPVTQEELQPKNGTVQVTFNYEENENLVQAEENEEQEVKVYHLNDIDEEGNKIEELTGTTVEEVVVNEEESEEENVMVVEAEKFSIYAIIKGASNVGDTITITYNANGGKFKSGNSLLDSINVIYTKQSNGDYKPNINVQAPDRKATSSENYSGWMFAGWYTTSTNQTTEWLGKTTDTITNNKTVYAKWLPFNTIELNEVGLTGVYMMDRNMGAENFAYGTAYSNVTYHEDYGKLGYYYQWGNNYGFKNNGNIDFDTNNRINGDEYGPNNYYSSSLFKRINTSPYRWTNENAKYLWGGENLFSDIDKQGPCPEGYHVPDTQEWNKLYESFSLVNESNTDFCGSLSNFYSLGKCFASKYKLPFAGRRKYSDMSIGYYDSNYWSSSYTGEDLAYSFQIYGDASYKIIPQQKEYRAFGYPVRCFKDSEIKKITFLTEGGENVSEINVKRWSSISYSDLPNNPEKDGFEFLGWYELGSSEEYDFSQPTLKNVTLYERWISDEGFEEKESAKLVVGKKLNAIMKTLSKGSLQEFGDNDDLIIGIEKSQILSHGGTKKLISTSDSETPVIARYDENSQKIKYYTNAKNVYLNEDSSYMFSRLKNLKSFEINQFKTDYVINMARMFDNSFSSLEGLSLDFTNLNLSGVEDMSYMFNYISNGSSSSVNISGVTIDFSNTIMNNVKTMKGMFYFSFYSVANANGVKIDFSNAEINDETDMSEMFYELGYDVSSHTSSWDGLTIDFSNAHMRNVRNIQKMFYYSLYTVENISNVKIDFSNVEMDSVINMSNMFFEFCYGTFSTPGQLSGVIIDFSGVNMYNVENMESLFEQSFRYYNINNIKINFKNATFKNENISSAINMKKMFNGSFQGVENKPLALSGLIIDFSNLDLSRVENMESMFGGSLEYWKKIDGVDIDFRKSDLGGVINMYGMFSNFGKGKSDNLGVVSGVTIDFSETKLSSVENMKEMFTYSFGYLTGINNVRIDFTKSNFSGNTTNAVDMQKMFYYFGIGHNSNAEYLSGVTIDFSESNMSRVSNMSSMFENSFRNWKNIAGLSINFSNVKMNDVTNMKQMFYDALYTAKNADGLTIDFSNAKMGNVTDMSSMFNAFLYGGSSSSNSDFISGVIIDFSDADISRVTSMVNMFYMTFGSLNANGVKIDFSKVNFGAENSGGELDMTRMFENFNYQVRGFSSGVTIDFSESNMSRVTKMEKMFYNAFEEGKNANGIKIDFSKVNFGTENSGGELSMKEMFYYFGEGKDNNAELSGITIDFSESNMSRVTNMYGMFYYAFSNYKNKSGIEINFRNVEFGSESNSSYLTMEKMFDGSFYGNGTQLISGITIDFSESNMSRVTNMSNMFHYTFAYGMNISGIKIDFSKVDFSNENANALLNMEKMFYEFCYGSESESISGLKIDFSNLDLSRVNNIEEMFSHSFRYIDGENLDKIEIDFENTIFSDTLTNMKKMFYNCGLKDFDLSSFDTRNVENMESMFHGAKNIKTIYVGDKFILNSTVSSGNMFTGAKNIVGGNGTIYNPDYINGEYAVIDDSIHSGYFTNILDKPYKITYKLNGGIMSGERTIYTQRDLFVLPVPIRDGYIFVGWVGSNGKNPEKNVKITAGTKGDLFYEAQWSAPSSAGGRKIQQQVKEQEHNVAEEKTEENKVEQEENKIEETNTQEKTDTKTTQETTKTTTNTSSQSTSVTKEVQSAYEWAYDHDVTTMPTLEIAMPDGVVKRGHLAKMVVNYAVNVLGYTIPEKIPSECRWNDNKKDWESEEIKEYAVKSCALGLMGLDMPKFLPNLEVTRAQFGTIMSRLLWGKKYAGGTPYYRKHLNALKENNIMTQIENPERRVELRQWVWLMLMRSAEYK